MMVATPAADSSATAPGTPGRSGSANAASLGFGPAAVFEEQRAPGMIQSAQQAQNVREQVPGVLERYQRRTTRLIGQVIAVVRGLAGRAECACFRRWASWLPGIGTASPAADPPLPALAVPRVLGIDDFALRCGLVCTTVLIDA